MDMLIQLATLLGLLSIVATLIPVVCVIAVAAASGMAHLLIAILKRIDKAIKK